MSRTMFAVDISQEMSEGQRAEAFREFHAEQLRKQTKALDTIRSLMILWTLLTVVAVIIVAAGSFTGTSGF